LARAAIESEMADVTLNLVVLRSADLERAAGFYGLLGLKFIREQHGSGPEHLACCLGGVVLEIYPNPGSGDQTLVRIGLSVPSVEDAVRAVRDGAGVFLTPPNESPWGKRAVVADPDGHRVELIERRT
jgi:catechol 2,3-dioxygenase-like lactoylglutathione lyase family enzyme